MLLFSHDSLHEEERWIRNDVRALRHVITLRAASYRIHRWVSVKSWGNHRNAIFLIIRRFSRICSTVICDNPIFWPNSRIFWRQFMSNSNVATIKVPTPPRNCNKFLNSCPTKDRVEGWDVMKPLYWSLWIARMPADHAWHTITGMDVME